MSMMLDHAIAQLEAGTYPYSEANAKKVRGSARKCAKLPAYNCPLEMIPVDVTSFLKKFAKNVANKDAPDGFKTFSQFKTWHSNVKSLMEHASGDKREKALLRQSQDDWTRLIAVTTELIRRGRNGVGIDSNQVIALNVLAGIARQNAVQPSQLTQDILHGFMNASVAQSQKTAIRRAARLIDRMNGLLTGGDRAILPGLIGEIPTATKRRITPELPAAVVQEIDDYKVSLQVGQSYGGLLSGRLRPGLEESTIKSHVENLRWYFSCLLELGFLSEEGELSIEELTTAEKLLAVFDAEVSGHFYWTPLSDRTIRKNMQSAFQFARQFHPDLSELQKEVFKSEVFQDCDVMTKPNQEFCRKLVGSTARTKKFLNLAQEFHSEAKPLIECFDQLAEGEKTKAVKFAMASAMAAILTFLPLRADTLIKLTCTGADANVMLPTGARTVRLNIEKGLMKNNKPLVGPLAARGTVDPRAILEWWLSEARVRLMHRIQFPDPARLLGGASYVYASDAWQYATGSVGMYMKLHQVRHAIASILINQPGSDINVIAALLNNSPATVARAYAFFDQSAAIERGQNGLADVNAALKTGKMS